MAQFINIFTTTPQQQQGLINETARIIKPQVLKLDGYGAAAFYRSLDGTKVVNYGQFRSFEDIRLMFRTPSILFAFVRVLFKNVTPPLFNMLGFKIGRGPKLRTYTVESIYRR